MRANKPLAQHLHDARDIVEPAVDRFYRGVETLMRKSTFSEKQITDALAAARAGGSVDNICKGLGISISTFYIWKQRYDEMSGEQVAVSRTLEEQAGQLRRQLSQELRDSRVLKAILADLNSTA